MSMGRTSLSWFHHANAYQSERSAPSRTGRILTGVKRASELRVRLEWAAYQNLRKEVINQDRSFNPKHAHSKGIIQYKDDDTVINQSFQRNSHSSTRNDSVRGD